jgi:hypothetical protein
MGYWWPPSLYAFDPTERILSPKWTGTPFGFGSIPVADPVDAEMLSILDDGFRPLVKAKGKAYAYAAMLKARAPEDPEGGGLCADRVNEDGSITIQYWDFSDSSIVQRKRVTYVSDPKLGQVITKQTGGLPEMYAGGKWQREGWDGEREFGKSGLDVVSAIMTIVSTALSVFPATSAAGLAFSAMWGMTLKALKSGGVPPSFDEVMATFGKLANIGGAWGIVSKSPDLQNLFKNGFIGEMARAAGTWKDKIGSCVTQIGSSMPVLPLPKMFQLGAKFDVAKWAGGEYKGLQTPAAASVTLGNRETTSLGDFSPVDVKRTSWDFAMRAFLEPDPDTRLRIRRNFLWSGFGPQNSSAVTQGDALGAGAHNEVEVDAGIADAASYFDQYLTCAIASVARQIEAETQLGTINVLVEARRNDPVARAALQKEVADLMDRYRMP